MSETRSERRERYEKLVGIVEANTNERQPMGIVDHAAVGILVKSGCDKKKARTTMRAAIENGEIIAVEDWSGRNRLYPADETQLVSMLEQEAGVSSPDRQRVATLNSALTEVRG